MYGALFLEQNLDGSYDLVIRYSRHDAEFGLDFLSGRQPETRRTIAGYLQDHAKGLRVRSARIVAGALVLAVLPIKMMLPAAAASDRYSMAYLYQGTQAQQMQYVKEVQGALDTVSPSYFDLAGDGSLAFNKPPSGAVAQYHQMGIRVIPFLSNHWDRQAGVNALEDPEALADEVAALIEEYDLDGVNVDLENLTPSEREAYVELMSLLREKIPAEKEVSVAVAANPWGWTWGWQGSYDYEGLGQFSDYLMLMTYDEHYQGGEAGPVAGIGFVEDAVVYALDHVEAEQVVVGLPLFGRIWSEDGTFDGHGVPLKIVEEMLATYDALIFYDEDAQSPKATFVVHEGDPVISWNYKNTLKPGTYTLWYEDERSIAAKLELVDDYDLKGTSFWSLGQQGSGVMDIYQNWRNGFDFPDPQPDPDEGEEEWDASEGEEENQEDGDGGISILPPSTGGSGNSTGTPSRPSRGGGSGGGSRGGGGGSSSGSSSLSSSISVNTASTVNTPAATLQRTATVAANGASLRKSPSDTAAVTANAHAGELASILGYSDGWYNIQLATGGTGHVPADSLLVHKIAVATANTGVRVYSGSSDTQEVVAYLTPGTALSILEEQSDGWCKVRLADKRVGYVPSKQLARTTINRPIVLKSATTALRLRETPTTNATSYGTLPAGEQVLILDNDHPGYTRISYGGTVAYVTNGYLK